MPVSEDIAEEADDSFGPELVPLEAHFARGAKGDKEEDDDSGDDDDDVDAA